MGVGNVFLPIDWPIRTAFNLPDAIPPPPAGGSNCAAAVPHESAHTYCLTYCRTQFCFPPQVGPIAQLPYLKKLAVAHQLHHSEKYDGAPWGMFLALQVRAVAEPGVAEPGVAE